jgi:arylsulfatase A-like enzyme
VGFLARLDELNLWEDTIVLITSDHGEEFWDHFQGFSKHGHSLYGELLNVPLFLYVPELSTKHLKTVDEEVSLVDVVPTIGDLLGLEFNEPLDGITLCPLLRGEGVHRTYPILATHHNANLQRTLRVCSVADGIKYIEPIAAQNVPSSAHGACFHWELGRELYNLHQDPREQHNEALLKPGAADTLAARTQAAFAKSLAPSIPASDASFVPPLPRSLREQLKAAGYLEG